MEATKTATDICPCPFCGSDAELHDTRRFVECQNEDCYARGPLMYSEADAVNAWNQRTAAPAALERL